MPRHQMDVTLDQLRVPVLQRRYRIQHPATRRPLVPATEERHVLYLLPPVPPRRLPTALSPRRTPLRLRARLAAQRVHRMVTGRFVDRALPLLIVAVVGACLAALVGLEAQWPSDTLGVAR